MNFRDLAEQHARQANLRDSRTCQDLFCEQYTVEAEIFMCMFYLWAEEYGHGWWENVVRPCFCGDEYEDHEDGEHCTLCECEEYREQGEE